MDKCSPTTGCINIEPECLCEDYDSCTTETCDPTLECVYVPIDCDDNNSYTRDYCDSTLGCVHEEYNYNPTPSQGY
jgi:hypothetical protein